MDELDKKEKRLAKETKEVDMSSGDEKPIRVSRREFVKGAAVGAGALAGTSVLASCAPAAAPAPGGTADLPATWDKEVDVVVVGFGGAGGPAAIEAADAGASVLLLDKLEIPGGSSVISTGAFAAAGTSMQAAEGVEDSPEKMYDFWMKAGMGVTDPELTEAICNNAKEALEWLTDLAGGDMAVWGSISFAGSGLASEEDVIPRIHLPADMPGGAWQHAAVQKAVGERSAIELLLETRATSLVVNADGKVVGVKATTAGEEKTFGAKRAVVLTTGDFARNDEMTKAFSRESYIADKFNAPAGTGDGIIMAQQVGAALACMEGTMSGLLAPKPGDRSPRRLAASQSILVNAKGSRYVNESDSAYWQGYRTYQQDGNVAFGIVDNTVASQGGTALARIFTDDLAEEIEQGYVVRANSIEELATACGMDPDILRGTIDMWNEDVANGLDRLYGRTGNLVPIQEAPFFAVKLMEYTIQTHGGVRTNGKAQVLDVQGQVISSLYAAGSTVGGFIGPFYQHSGGGIAQAYTMGRIAGQNAAAEEPWV